MFFAAGVTDKDIFAGNPTVAISTADIAFGFHQPHSFSITYRTSPFTVAWRTVLLPARCFTSTVSFGSHQLVLDCRSDLNAAHAPVKRSTSARNSLRSSPPRAMNAQPA